MEEGKGRKTGELNWGDKRYKLLGQTQQNKDCTQLAWLWSRFRPLPWPPFRPVTPCVGCRFGGFGVDFFLSFVFVASHQLRYSLGKALPVPLCCRRPPHAAHAVWKAGHRAWWGSSDRLHLLTLTGPGSGKLPRLKTGTWLPPPRDTLEARAPQLEDRGSGGGLLVLSVSEPRAGNSGSLLSFPTGLKGVQ